MTCGLSYGQSKSSQNESRFDTNQSTGYPVNSGGPENAGHFPGDCDARAALRCVEQGILTGISPTRFSNNINTMNCYYGMRGTIQFAKGIYDKFQSVDIHEIADQGLRGTGERYPFLGQIQASFGKHYIGDLTAHAGPEARQANSAAGSEAYHKTRQVAFGGPPTLRVAAHEAAHAVQGVTSSQLGNGVGKTGDRWEENADAVAHAVELGKSAEGLLDKTSGNPTPAADTLQFTRDKDQKRVETLLADKKLLIASNRGPVVKKGHLSLSAGGLATAMQGALGGGGTWISNSGTNPPVHELAARMERYSHTVDLFSPDSLHFESIINPLGLHDSMVYRPGLNHKFLAGDIESTEPFDVSHFSMDQRAYSAFYENVVNGWLWPVFHNLHEYVVPAPQDWEKYRETNQTFTDALYAGFSAEKDNVAWIQDYQLLLAPGMLREKLQKDTDRIGFFLHIPCANPDAFIEHLGEAITVEILHSLLQSDIVGLQMHDDAENFIKLVRKLSRPLGIDAAKIRQNNQGDFSVPVDKRVVVVKAFPISMDFEAQHKTGSTRSLEQAKAVVKQKFDEQMQSYPKMRGGVERRYDIDDVEATKATIDDPKSIWIGGIERADYTKGLHQRVDAIDLYFKENMEEISASGYKPVFVLTLAPSRENVPSYKNYVDTLYGKINHVNKSYQGDLEYAPIVLTGPVFDPEKSDLFAAYDVFIITALADGMNLTPLEVISTKHLDEQHDHRPAVFVLSEGAGVGRRAEFAEHCYGLDRRMEPEMIKGRLKQSIDEVIAARKDPEKMAELVVKNKTMQDFVRENEIMKWTADFLEQLLSGLQKHKPGYEFPDPGLETSAEFPDSGLEASAEFPKPGFNASENISMARLAAFSLMPDRLQPRSQWSRQYPGGRGYERRPLPGRLRPPGRLFNILGGLRKLIRNIRN